MNDDIPTESETIAVKRAARVAEKIARSRLRFTPAWWSKTPLEVLLVTVLFAVNLYLLSPALGTEAAKTSFSGPVIPLLANILKFFGVPFAYAIQHVVVLFFAFFPVSLYFFIRKIGGRKLAAFLAILFASLPVSPFAFSRIISAFFGEDSPHIASLTLIPLALLTQIQFLREGKFINLFFASLFVALVALTSPFGFFVLVAFATVTTFSEMLLGTGRLKIFRFLVIILVAAGLSSFWYNPHFGLALIMGPVGEEVRETVARLIPISFFIVPILAAFGFLLFDRRPELQPFFLASFYTIGFAIIVSVGGGFFPSHPSRYLSEFGISLAFLGGITLTRFMDFLKFNDKVKALKLDKPIFVNGFMGGLALALILAVVMGKSRVELTKREVLGLWTDVNRGEIWLQREQFRGVPAYYGYSITGMTIISLGLLGVTTNIRGKNNSA